MFLLSEKLLTEKTINHRKNERPRQQGILRFSFNKDNHHSNCMQIHDL